jgi:hypothetical protein
VRRRVLSSVARTLPCSRAGWLVSCIPMEQAPQRHLEPLRSGHELGVGLSPPVDSAERLEETNEEHLEPVTSKLDVLVVTLQPPDAPNTLLL